VVGVGGAVVVVVVVALSWLTWLPSLCVLLTFLCCFPLVLGLGLGRGRGRPPPPPPPPRVFFGGRCLGGGRGRFRTNRRVPRCLRLLAISTMSWQCLGFRTRCGLRAGNWGHPVTQHQHQRHHLSTQKRH
jgi:hypothetical protein